MNPKPRLRSYSLNSFVGWNTNIRGGGEAAYRNQPNPRYQSYLKMSDSAKGAIGTVHLHRGASGELVPTFFWA